MKLIEIKKRLTNEIAHLGQVAIELDRLICLDLSKFEGGSMKIAAFTHATGIYDQFLGTIMLNSKGHEQTIRGAYIINLKSVVYPKILSIFSNSDFRKILEAEKLEVFKKMEALEADIKALSDKYKQLIAAKEAYDKILCSLDTTTRAHLRAENLIAT